MTDHIEFDEADMDFGTEQPSAKRARLEPNPMLDWSSSFLTSQTTRVGKHSFEHDDSNEHDSNELLGKPNELEAVVFIPHASNQPHTSSSPSLRTQSTILHSDHIKPPPSQPEGISCSQPLPEEDFDMYEPSDTTLDDNVADDASTATNTSVDSLLVNDPADDDIISDKDDYLIEIEKRLKHLESSPAAHYSQYHFLVGMLKMTTGDFEEALTSFKHADRLFAPFVGSSDDAEPNPFHVELQTAIANATVDSAIESVRAGNSDSDALRNAFKEAQTILSSIQLKVEGMSIDVWNDICLLLLKAADLPAAIQMYEFVVRAYPRAVDLKSNLSACLLRAGDVESAASLLQTTLTSHPSHVASLINYACVLATQHRHSEASKFLRLVVSIDRDSFRGWHNLGVQYQIMGQLDNAALCFKSAQQLVNIHMPSGRVLASNMASHHISRARLENDMTQKHILIEAARELLNSLLKVEPRSSSTIASLADCHQIMNETSEALHKYDLAISISPACFEALNGRGLIMLQQRNLSEAEQMFTQAISSLGSTDTNTPPTMMNLGIVLSAQRRFADSKSLLQVALKLAEQHWANDSTNATLDVFCGCLVNLGSIHRKMNELSAAETLYTRCLELAPSNLAAVAGLALVHADAKQWQAADELLQQIIVSSSATPAQIAAAKHNRLEMLKKQQSRSQ